MWKIFHVKLLNLRNNYKPYLFMLIFPLVFTFVFSVSMSGGEPTKPVPVVDHDNSKFSKKLVEELNNHDVYRVRLVDEKVLTRLVSENRVDVGLIIPKDFERQIKEGLTPRLDVVITKATPELYSFEGVLRSSVQKIAYHINIIDQTVKAVKKYLDLDQNQEQTLRLRIDALVSEKWKETLPINVEGRMLRSNSKKHSYDVYTQNSLGFTIAFSMFTFIFAIGEILEDKENGIWNRISISPLSKFQIYSGNLLYAFTVGFIQIMILVLVGVYAFGVNWGANIPGVALILGGFIFSTVSLGLLMSTVVKNYHQLQVIAPVVIVSTSMIGGAYWPLEIVSSKILLTAAKFVPQGWAMKGLKALILYNQGIEAVYLPLAVLLLMGVIFMGSALYLNE